MRFQPRSRKRVYATRRAPDGSAFQTCDSCGLMIAVALIDMHECGENKREVKRFKGLPGTNNSNHHHNAVVSKDSLCVQLRSPFRFFMEKFTESCVDEDFIEVDRKGFQTWKNMSLEERQPYIDQAEAVNSAYQKLLDEEVNDMFQVDDEADSAMVGKFDPFYEDFEKSGDDFIFKWYGGSESFESDKGGMGHMQSSWIVEDSS
ncbi:hypothetical protein ACFE04_018198 [Oxalis oulophora]